MNIIVIDIGGTHEKILTGGRTKPVEIPFGPKMTPAKMVTAVRAATVDWKYDAVSLAILGRYSTTGPSLNHTILAVVGLGLTSRRSLNGNWHTCPTKRAGAMKTTLD